MLQWSSILKLYNLDIVLKKKLNHQSVGTSRKLKANYLWINNYPDILTLLKLCRHLCTFVSKLYFLLDLFLLHADLPIKKLRKYNFLYGMFSNNENILKTNSFSSVELKLIETQNTWIKKYFFVFLSLKC